MKWTGRLQEALHLPTAPWQSGAADPTYQGHLEVKVTQEQGCVSESAGSASLAQHTGRALLRPGSFSSFQACVGDGIDDSKQRKAEVLSFCLSDLFTAGLECCWLRRFIGQMEVFAQLRVHSPVPRTPSPFKVLCDQAGKLLATLSPSVTQLPKGWPLWVLGDFCIWTSRFKLTP